MCNKTRETVFRYDTISSSTNTTNHLMSFTLLKTNFKGLCTWPLASHSEAGRGDSRMRQIHETGPIVKVSTTVFPRPTRKGAQCSKYLNCTLTYPCLSLTVFLEYPSGLWDVWVVCFYINTCIWPLTALRQCCIVILSLYCCYSQRNVLCLNIWNNINNIIFKLFTAFFNINFTSVLE